MADIPVAAEGAGISFAAGGCIAVLAGRLVGLVCSLAGTREGFGIGRGQAGEGE